MNIEFTTALILAWGSLQERERQLASSLQNKSAVYLDTNHWVNIRKVLLKDITANQEYAAIYARLQYLRKKDLIFCPLSTPLAEELMRQEPKPGYPDTRRATAELMDELSGGICLRTCTNLLCQEWYRFLWRNAIAAIGVPSLSVWTRAGFWSGVESILERSDLWDPNLPPEAPMHWLNLTWNETFVDLANRRDFKRRPDSMVDEFLQLTNNSTRRENARQVDFEEVRFRERTSLFHAMKDDFSETHLPPGTTKDRLKDLIATAASTNDPSILPSLHVVSSISAALLQSPKVINSHDLLDHTHATAALPYCEAFFCDGPTAHLVTTKPLQLAQTYDTKVFSKPADILAYLNTLDS